MANNPIQIASEFATVVASARGNPARDKWLQLGIFYGFIALLHLIGWGLFLHYSARYPALVGLGLVAYLLGLRHAFDADHIAAIDDTVRYLLQKGRQPLGVGLFFSLGHSTVVFILAVATIFAVTSVKQQLPELQQAGAIIGSSVSGAFLWIIGILNLLVLLDMLKIWRQARAGVNSPEPLADLLARRGLLNRLSGGRLYKLINHGWQMYPLGFLFGLGFDTASEIGLLAITAGAATSDLPALATLSLPILFTAGMSIMDTTDGVLMTKAYGWAFIHPLRKIFYNLVTTGLSIAVALVLGSIELLQVMAELLHLDGDFFSFVNKLDLGSFGYLIVGLFLLAWVISVTMWKFGLVGRRQADVMD